MREVFSTATKHDISASPKQSRMHMLVLEHPGYLSFRVSALIQGSIVPYLSKLSKIGLQQSRVETSIPKTHRVFNHQPEAKQLGNSNFSQLRNAATERHLKTPAISVDPTFTTAQNGQVGVVVVFWH